MFRNSGILALLLSLVLAAAAQTVVPFSETELETGLRAGVTPTRMATLVQKNGVAFKLTPTVEEHLRAAGADDTLLAIIAKNFHLSGVMQGQLIQQVVPVYPPVAKAARVQGAVVLAVIIDESGNVTDVKIVSGHPLLQQAAVDAVKQWKYRPYRMQGKPIAVDTTVTVNFQLSGG